MKTTAAGQRLREQINVFMGTLTIPERTPTGEAPTQREDGVLEFYKHWTVRAAGEDTGLYATYADHDDVIEFGLSERQGEVVRNVLQATLVLTEEGGEFNVVSEANAELNLDARILPEKTRPLQYALRYFAESVRAV